MTIAPYVSMAASTALERGPLRLMSDSVSPRQKRRSVVWRRPTLVAGFVVVAALGAPVGVASSAMAASGPTSRYIVEGSHGVSASSVVRRVHGRVDSDLAAIHAVVASLTPGQAAALSHVKNVSVTPDSVVKVSGTTSTSSTCATTVAPAATTPAATVAPIPAAAAPSTP